MVERLCRDYGTPLLQSSITKFGGLDDASSVKAEGPAEEEQQQQQVPDLAFYAFPSLEQLSSASEAALRAEGFGYRYAIELLLCSADTLHALVNSACWGSVIFSSQYARTAYAYVDSVVLKHVVGSGSLHQ